jgi:hypothetical protein
MCTCIIYTNSYTHTPPLLYCKTRIIYIHIRNCVYLHIYMYPHPNLYIEVHTTTCKQLTN